MDISGLPPMDPIEMTSILSDEAAVTALPAVPSSVESPPPAAFLDLSPSFTAEEELETQQLSGTSDDSGAVLDLSDQPWDPTADPANPDFWTDAA